VESLEEAFGLRQAAQSTTPEAHPHWPKTKKETSMSHKDFNKKPRVKLVGKFLCLIEIDH